MQKNKSEILIVCNYDGAIKYIPNLVKHLLGIGIKVDILDIKEYRFIQFQQNGMVKINNLVNPILNNLVLIRKVSRLYFTKRFLKQIENQYSVVNLHYATKAHVPYISEYRRITKRIVLTMWGSDFYRDRLKEQTELKQILLYDKVDIITCSNEFFRDEFCSLYKEKFNRNYRDKFRIMRWGLDIIDEMNTLSKKHDRVHLLGLLGIERESVIITIGYNASIYQQHDRIVKCLKTVIESYFRDALILFPMTYRYDAPGYKEELKCLLCSLGLNHIILDQEMSDEEIAALRLVTDITINMQTSDDLSGSIQEHLFSGNIVVVGDWLPYEIYNEHDIYLVQTSFNNLSTKVSEIYSNLDEYKEIFNKNQSKVYRFSSWEFNLPVWLEVLFGE